MGDPREPELAVGPISRPESSMGFLGLAAGILGLAAAVSGPLVIEATSPPRPKVAEILADAGDRFVGRMLDRARGKKGQAPGPPATPPPRPWGSYLAVAGTSLGLTGAVLGTIGWIRREDRRVTAAAIAAGSMTLAWISSPLALAIALVVVLRLSLASPWSR